MVEQENRIAKMDFRENQKGKLNKSKIGEEIRWEVKGLIN